MKNVARVDGLGPFVRALRRGPRCCSLIDSIDAVGDELGPVLVTLAEGAPLTTTVVASRRVVPRGDTASSLI